jgi:hypothetical protein
LPTLDAAQESRLNRLINREVGRRMVRLGADPGSLPAKLRTRGGSQRAMAFMADHRSSIARQEPTLEMADG